MTSLVLRNLMQIVLSNSASTWPMNNFNTSSIRCCIIAIHNYSNTSLLYHPVQGKRLPRKIPVIRIIVITGTLSREENTEILIIRH